MKRNSPDCARAYSGFCNIDDSHCPKSYLSYVNWTNEHQISRLSKELLVKRILRPRTGEYILDIGCGAGHDVHTLARLVGREGHVVGIDQSKTMIRAAQQQQVQRQRPTVEFRVCDAHHLHFPDNTFDACLAVGTLMFMKNPSQVLKEVFRVLKPGGRLVAHEADWDSLAIAGGDAATTNTIVRIIKHSLYQSGIGHQLPVLFWQAEFKNILVEACTLTVSDYVFADKGWRIEATLDEARMAGVISSARSKSLLNQLRAADDAGQFFGTCTAFAVAATKPRVYQRSAMNSLQMKRPISPRSTSTKRKKNAFKDIVEQ